MTFSTRDVRRGMDVFSSDGVFLGSVIHVRHRPAAPTSAYAGLSPHGESPDQLFSGESLGPMPTSALGNHGPVSQSRAVAPLPLDAGPNEASLPHDLFVFRTLVGLDWGTLWPRLRRYPMSLVLNVSHERIVLAATAEELDAR